MAKPGAIKGSLLREFLIWYVEREGEAILEPMVQSLSPDDRRLVDLASPALGLLASTWYPCTLVHGLLDFCGRGLSREEQRKLAREGNAFVVPRMVRGTYRVLFERLATPSLYARFIQPAWRQLHTTGERSMKLIGDHEVDSEVSNWPCHHPLLCDLTVETMTSVFQLMVGTPVQATRISCVSEGGARCRTLLRWKPRGDRGG